VHVTQASGRHVGLQADVFPAEDASPRRPLVFYPESSRAHGKAKILAGKAEHQSQARSRVIQKSYAGIPAGAQVLVSTPREVAAFVRRIPAGRFVAPEQVRRRLAAKHNANAACPLATGIFLRIVAEAAWEQNPAASGRLRSHALLARDPAALAPRKKVDMWRSLRTQDAAPGINRSVSGAFYRPGSRGVASRKTA